MKIIVTLVLFIGFPYILRILLKKGITHRRFALLTSLLYATLFFLLSIMLAKNDAVVIGTILFICMIIGGYPSAYFLYPILNKSVTSK
jgi:hypothetical protein